MSASTNASTLSQVEEDSQQRTAPFVFVSYSHHDLEFVQQMLADLEKARISCWFDKSGLKPGTPDWEQSVRDAISGCAAVVLVASPDSRQTKYVGGEIEVARMYDRHIYIIWAAGDHYPDSVRMDMAYSQYLDARGALYATALAQLVEQLREVNIHPARESTIPVVAEPDVRLRNPYKGLAAFRCSDAGDFFGRAKDVDRLLQSIKQAMREGPNGVGRLLAIVGPSGSGKSSLAMAGLLPALLHGGVEGSQEWIYLGERASPSQRVVDPVLPGDHPLEALALAIGTRLQNRSLTSIREDLDDDSCRGLHRLARMLTTHGNEHVLILVDQFEELFSPTCEEHERRQFIDLLVAAVTESQGPTVVILTMRADFYHHLMNYPDFWQLVDGPRTCNVVRLEVENLRQVIEGPAKLPDSGLVFEGDLIGDILFEVRDQQATLPLLEFTLDQLFKHREGQRITLAAYRQIAGVTGALGKHADDVYEALPSEAQRALARELFLRLINPASSEERPTRRRFIGELTLSDPTETQMIRQVAQIFVRERLLTAGTYAGQASLELSHEALVQSWERLRTWSREDLDGRRIRDDLISRSEQWDHHGRDPAALYEGSLLQEASQWYLTRKPILSQLEHDFLVASADEAARINAKEVAAQTASARLVRGWVAPLFVGLVSGAVFFALAIGSKALNLATALLYAVTTAVAATALLFFIMALTLGVLLFLERRSGLSRRARTARLTIAVMWAAACGVTAGLIAARALSSVDVVSLTERGRLVTSILVGLLGTGAAGLALLWATSAPSIASERARVPALRDRLKAVARLGWMPVVLTVAVAIVRVDVGPWVSFVNTDPVTQAGRLYDHAKIGDVIYYDQYPPNHGVHYPPSDVPAWGAYETPVKEGGFVHNLEHGGIVVLYNCPQGCPELVDNLVQLPDKLPRESSFHEVKVIVSPYETCADFIDGTQVCGESSIAAQNREPVRIRKLQHPITVLAWDYEYDLDQYDFDGIERFYQARVDKGPEQTR